MVETRTRRRKLTSAIALASAALRVAKAVGSRQEAQSFAQPLNRVLRLHRGVGRRLKVRITVMKAIQITDQQLLVCIGLLSDRGRQVRWCSQFLSELRQKITVAEVEHLPRASRNGKDSGLFATAAEGLGNRQCSVDLPEGGTHVCFGASHLLCRVGGLGRGLIVVRRRPEPSNEANCYTNERNRDRDEGRPT